MKKLIFIFALLVSFIINAQEDSSQTPKIAIKIELGETIKLPGVSLKFAAVVEDSRCPKNTHCIWAGRAVVLVDVEANESKEQKKIYLGETRNNEPTSKTLFSKENYSIEVIALKPYPEDGKEKTAYTLLVCEGN
ncbi:MAG: hypothetical protein R2781_00315 [Flavobacteriaceae bacterium]